MNFVIGQQSEVSFAVNVMGTSAEPTCRAILETFPELGFPCHRVGDRWATTVAVPFNLRPGTYKLRVEVILNNRLFTPFSKPVEVSASPVTAEVSVTELPTVVDQEAKPEVMELPAEVDLPVPDDVKFEEVEAAEPPAPVQKPAANFDFKSVFNSTQPQKVEEAVEPAQPKKISLPADFFKFTPKEVKKVEIKLPPLEESLKHIKTSGKPKSVKVVELKQTGVPVTLTKGDIVYE